MAGDPDSIIPKKLLREKDIGLPEVSEVEVFRHYTRLSQQNYGVDLGIYPLGSCTMKYTPKVCEAVAASSKIQDLHPYEDESLTQGILEVLYKLERYLAEITGMDKFSLQSSAGAHGELVGALIMRAYHKSTGQLETRTEMIVPDSAHGTNPASATMEGCSTMMEQTSTRY
jgi:glycine dehydrogenase subunit 2